MFKISRSVRGTCGLRMSVGFPSIFCRAFTGGNNLSEVSDEALYIMEQGYDCLSESTSKSLLKKHLTRPIFDKLKTRTTSKYHARLLDCIGSGMVNHDSGVGVYAPDPEAYETFEELFIPIIEDYHSGFKASDKQPPLDFGDLDEFCNLDPENLYVVSTRIRCARSIIGYPFNPCMRQRDYIDLEDKIKQALFCLDGEHAGEYLALCDMSAETQQKLICDKLLFKPNDRFLHAAKATRYWPAGRGIYLNKERNFLVWCNEEDHLRIIAMEKGGDLGKVYRRMFVGVQTLDIYLPFIRHEQYGFLTFCPTNLGTTIRASVHIKLPKLAADKQKLEALAAKYELQVRGTRGEHTDAEGGVYDISNKRRLGLTEYEAVKTMQDGIFELIKAEQQAP